MKKEDIKIGMKVVPFQKTEEFCTLEESNHWKEALKRKQNYLYVNGTNGDRIILGVDNDFESIGRGDYFSVNDFKLYKDFETHKILIADTNIKNEIGYIDIYAEIKDNELIIKVENHDGYKWVTKCDVKDLLIK